MVAEAVAIGWFVPTAFAKVLELAICFASGKWKRHRDREQQKKFDRLAKLLQSTKKAIERATESASSRSAADGGINEVVWRFKDAIDDAEELLNTLLYEDADAKVNGTTYMAALFGNSASSLLTRLDTLIDDLSEISNSLQQHLPQPQPAGDGSGGSSIRTTHQPTDRKLYGYSDQYSALLSSLLQQQLQGQCDHQVVAVIGHGGTGKTALAWRAFRNQDVRASFDLRIWVCVSAKFTATDLLREICKSAAQSAGRADVVVPEREDDVKSLRDKLKDIILHHQADDDNGKKKTTTRRRYLLVLDDVCNDESAKSDWRKSEAWDIALAPFKQHGAGSSRILMTTRAEICTTTRLGAAEPPIVLDGLDAKDMKRLIANTAFGKQGPPAWWLDDSALDDHVAKLCGSPLLAEAFGNRLKGKVSISRGKRTRDDEREMQQIMSKEIPLVVRETHLSSYQNLPPHLQRCLAFCSLFPTAWVFEQEKLVKMWVALGFIIIEEHPSGGTGDETEETAMGYFDALRKRCLFQKAPAAEDSESSGYVIDKHIHSVLRMTKVCRNYFLSIDDSCSGGGPKECDLLMARHLAVTITTNGSVDKLLKKIVTAKKVRTLIVFQRNSNVGYVAAMLHKNILKQLNGVRVMDLSDTSIHKVTGSIGMLKQARYLGLPITVGEMSSQVTTLSLLRYLDMPMEHIARIAGIGSLQKLQGSVEFHVHKAKDGHSMMELEKLDSLSGTLSIMGLEAVKTKQEAESAQLRRKGLLKVLKLEWGHCRVELQPQASSRSPSDSIVLTGLQPHHNLQELYISRYQGTATPRWMAHACVLQNLRSLYLSNCSNLLELPPVGELPQLQVLELQGMHSLMWIDGTFCCSGMFTSLERLMLNGMPKLQGWDWESVAGAADHNQLAKGRRRAASPPIRFPQLREVEIEDCPNLSSLSALSTCRESLSFLRVKRCPAVRATFKSSDFPSLRKGTTDIQDCSGLVFMNG